MTLEEAMEEIFYHGFVFTLRPKKALEALKVIRKTLLDYEQLKSDYIDIDKQLRTANTEIDRLKSVSSWIPCSERMPDDNVDVLVYDGVILIARYNTYDKYEIGWMESLECYPLNSVTHWMPLPEIPKRKDDTHDYD